ncbi:GIY-YIG nuclease family protein [Candidatus Sororendozoicomonas aggregata]|uniref:GIY-YIG nuclease family protein n=1 Tax=Candidatus Sororendozoicomonas aggregata TaxID=3073239 RepID=UPI002ED3BF00
MPKQFAVYILASQPRGTLYIGVTSNLVQRMWQHRNKSTPGFTERYAVEKLVWYEMQPDSQQAIKREKQLKQWKRDWKIRLIEQSNCCWDDLWKTLL